MKNKRMKPEARRDDILRAALQIASNGTHYLKVTREQIANVAKVSGPAVQYHFKTMTQLRKQLMRAAVKQECLPVIAQGVVSRDTVALRAPDDLKLRAVQAIAV